MDIDLESKLLRGSEIVLDGIKIKPLTIGQIVDDIGYTKYLTQLNIVTADKSKLTNASEEALAELKVFDILVHFEEFRNTLLDFLKIFLHNKDIVYIEESNCFIVPQEEQHGIIHRDNLDSFFDLFKLMYNVQIEKEEEYNPANEKAREIIEKLKRNKQNRPQPKEEVNFFSVISGVAWKAQNINIFNIWDLTIYQLYDAYYRLELIDNYDKTINGVYAGTIDGSKIDFKKLNWIKKTKI